MMKKKEIVPRAPDWEMVFGFLAKVGVWSLLFGLLYILRSFFVLIFLTFVFSYILQRGVVKLERYFGSRPLRVVLATFLLLGTLTTVGAYLAPKFKEQARVFIDRYPEYVSTLDTNLAQLTARYPFLDSLVPRAEEKEAGGAVSKSLIKQAMGVEGGGDLKETIAVAKDIGGMLLSIVSSFFLALLFSFLIVLDLPSLISGVKDLEKTKLRFVYEEVADSIHDFGLVLGRAFEAQLFVAIVNTVLTAIGLSLLGLNRDMAFLSVIVFLCSFIPVAGVFISSVPICLVALQDGGIQTTLFVIGLITVIHWIEAYILNPRIYGHHLRMNPVVVLIILTVAGKLFHFWGLVLGVPICNYLFSYAIRGRRA